MLRHFKDSGAFLNGGSCLIAVVAHEDQLTYTLAGLFASPRFGCGSVFTHVFFTCLLTIDFVIC